jgi:propionyl-CoA synthetase
MEEVVAAHPAVAECAVIGIADSLRGQVPLALAVLKNDAGIEPAALEREVVQAVRDQVGAVANLKRVVVVKRLPKTRSGKILRAVLRSMADGEAYAVPSTIDDPAVLEEVRGALLRG